MDYSSEEEFDNYINGIMDNRRRISTRKVIRDFQDPFDYYSCDEFRRRYRFSKDVVLSILLPQIRENLEKLTARGLPVPPIYQLLVALRFYSSGSFQDLPDFIPLSPDQVNRDRHITVEEQDMETSKQGPDMDNGKTTKEQSTQTENDESKEELGTDRREVKDKGKKPEKENKDVSYDKKSVSHEEECEKSEESEHNGWWRYLYPFYYFV